MNGQPFFNWNHGTWGWLAGSVVFAGWVIYKLIQDKESAPQMLRESLGDIMLCGLAIWLAFDYGKGTLEAGSYVRLYISAAIASATFVVACVVALVSKLTSTSGVGTSRARPGGMTTSAGGHITMGAGHRKR